MEEEGTGPRRRLLRTDALTWRQANSQFQARQATLKLDKDHKDIDEDGTEDLRQADREEHRMDIKRIGLQIANESEVSKIMI